MALLANFVAETCNAPGTAASVNLAGAVTGRHTFASAFANGTQTFYFMDDGTQQEWGFGTFTSGSPNTFSRDTVLKNSAGTTSRQNFTGTVTIYNEVPAEREVYTDTAANLSLPGNLAVAGNGSVVGTLTAADGTGGKQVVNLSQFASVLTGLGYQKLPSGLIIQWYTRNPAISYTSPGTTITETFGWPIPFPAACLFAMGGLRAGNVPGAGLSIESPTTTGATMTFQAAASTTLVYTAFAIGG